MGGVTETVVLLAPLLTLAPAPAALGSVIVQVTALAGPTLTSVVPAIIAAPQSSFFQFFLMVCLPLCSR